MLKSVVCAARARGAFGYLDRELYGRDVSYRRGNSSKRFQEPVTMEALAGRSARRGSHRGRSGMVDGSAV